MSMKTVISKEKDNYARGLVCYLTSTSCRLATKLFQMKGNLHKESQLKS